MRSFHILVGSVNRNRCLCVEYLCSQLLVLARVCVSINESVGKYECMNVWVGVRLNAGLYMFILIL